MYTDSTGYWFGFDDIITGPIDELIVLSLLALAAAVGIPGASDALSDLTNTLIDVLAAKKSRKSGKEKSSEKPSYVNKGMLDKSLTAEENATNMMNNQWGKGNWGKGPKTDYNKTLKWITRGELLKQVINSFDGYDDDYILVIKFD